MHALMDMPGAIVQCITQVCLNMIVQNEKKKYSASPPIPHQTALLRSGFFAVILYIVNRVWEAKPVRGQGASLVAIIYNTMAIFLYNDH